MIYRRRCLLSSGTQRVLFQAANVSVEAGECLNTGIPVMRSGLSVTIALDFTATSNPGGSTAMGCLYKLLQMNTTRELCIGKYNGGDSKLNAWWCPSSNSDYTALDNTTPAIGRKRIIVTHAADSNDITIYTKMGDSTVQTFTISSTYAPTNLELSVGYNSDQLTRSGLPDGTINEISIHNYIWSSDQITEFMT